MPQCRRFVAVLWTLACAFRRAWRRRVTCAWRARRNAASGKVCAGRRRAPSSESARIDPVGLADHTHRTREVTRLARVHAGEPDSRDLKRLAQQTIIATAGLKDNPIALPGAGPREGSHRFGGILYPTRTAAGMVNVKPVLGDIDADEDFLHDGSCSCSAGSAPTAPVNGSG